MSGHERIFKGLASARSKIVAEGFDDAGVHAGRRQYLEHPEESVDVVTVVLLHDSMDGDVARKTAATVVWNELPMRFDILTIEYQGEVRDIEYSWLANELGPRANRDRKAACLKRGQMARKSFADGACQVSS
ncbi:hypothetical protein [Promicromonospora sp. NPDC023987]|uniref:hypothetical protein n=1 Tax=Promicromonospora sp. NPDC023987 TaxID=3155360 RepID=UPI0033FAE171